MNRLWVRLTLAFIFVALISAAVVAVLATTSADNQFRDYLNRRDTLAQSGLLTELADYYQQTGSWVGADSILANFSPNDGSHQGSGSGAGRGRPPLLLADAAGLVIYDERNERVGTAFTASELATTLPVSANDQIAGYLLLGAQGRGTLSPNEQNFLDQLRGTLIVAALIAAGLGIAIGLLMSRTLAAPLSKLSGAARAFAAPHWDQRVAVNGTQEMADVATAFNDMADSLQQAEVLRRNLMADVAHELRTPLTVIQGNLRAILDGVYPLEREEIATLYDETRLLQRLVDDLRELALAEAKQLKLNVQPIDLRPLIEATTGNFGAAADEQQITLSAHLPDQLPPVQADADRVGQVLRNLVGNALRHTLTGGSIAVEVTTTTDRVRVSVIDSGEGIPPEELPHVFDRFYRGDRSRARSSGGSGLGLAITKSLIEAMGGAIGVESRSGAGSTFWFTLPDMGYPSHARGHEGRS
ncbi:MAG: HAMP domain-containing protein [Chloroflexi bacterium]|nr:HAMP domain-containing protein [Chloroflexota bacterium]